MDFTNAKKTNEPDIILDLEIMDNDCKSNISIKKAIAEAEMEILAFNESIESINNLKPNCDKLDYMLAAGSGALCGMIDIFLVGIPKDSPLIKLTDDWFAKRTIDFANLCAPEGKKFTDLKSAIKFLEETFPVPYDQTTPGEAAKKIFNLNTFDHHFKSLSHNPSLLGLYSAIMDQLHNTSTFVSEGRFIILEKAKKHWDSSNNKWVTEKIGDILEKFDTSITQESLPIKVIKGFITWVCHLISDLSGSSKSALKSNRGMGIPSPIWTLINDITAIKSELKIDVSEIELNLHKIAVEIFKKGYDFRFQSTQAIPVIINEILVRLLYSLRRLFKYFKNTKKENRSFKLLWEQCEPFSNATVKRMLTVAHATFCLIDAADAGIRAFKLSKGELFIFSVEFFLRLNIVGVGRFTISLYGETKRIIKYRQAKKDITFIKNEKVIVENYIKGLKILNEKYKNSHLISFVDDFEKSDLYIDAFEKSILLAESRNVPSNKILKTKKDIDAYFGGKNND